MPRYRLSGLIVDSSLPLPELRAARGRPSCTFALSWRGTRVSTPRWYHHWREPGGRRALSLGRTPRGYLLRFPGLADFEVAHDGSRVRGRRRKAVPVETFRHLLLDQVWPLVLSARGQLVLHASAVLRPDGRAIALAGPAGTGKSSLAAALAALGCQILTDDCLLIRRSGGKWMAVPSYPGLRLWPDMLSHLRKDMNRLADVAHYTGKKRLDARFLPFARGVAPLATVYLLHPVGHRRSVVITPAAGAAALMKLVPLAYTIDPQQRKPLERSFAQLAALAGTIPVRRVDLPHARNRLAEAARRLMA